MLERRFATRATPFPVHAEASQHERPRVDGFEDVRLRNNSLLVCTNYRFRLGNSREFRGVLRILISRRQALLRASP